MAIHWGVFSGGRCGRLPGPRPPLRRRALGASANTYAASATPIHTSAHSAIGKLNMNRHLLEVLSTSSRVSDTNFTKRSSAHHASRRTTSGTQPTTSLTDQPRTIPPLNGNIQPRCKAATSHTSNSRAAFRNGRNRPRPLAQDFNLPYRYRIGVGLTGG